MGIQKTTQGDLKVRISTGHEPMFMHGAGMMAGGCERGVEIE